jgi:hypothetical protein
VKESLTNTKQAALDQALTTITEPPAAPPKAKRPKWKAENPPDKFTNALQAFAAERRKTGWRISRPWTASAAEKPQWSGPFAKTYSFPGNPDIDSNLNKPNAPIPTHGNLQWVSTSGMEAYDTPSGDLESGDYGQESDGSYISNIPAYTTPTRPPASRSPHTSQPRKPTQPLQPPNNLPSQQFHNDVASRSH